MSEHKPVFIGFLPFLHDDIHFSNDCVRNMQEQLASWVKCNRCEKLAQTGRGWLSWAELFCINTTRLWIFDRLYPYYVILIGDNHTQINPASGNCQKLKMTIFQVWIKANVSASPTFTKTSLIKIRARAEREPKATVFTLAMGKIDFHDFNFLTLSKQINLNFDLKTIYCPALCL